MSIRRRFRAFLILGLMLSVAAGVALGQGIAGPTAMTSLDQDTFVITVTNTSTSQDACQIVITNAVPNATYTYVLGTAFVTLHTGVTFAQDPVISGLDLIWDLTTIFGSSYELPPEESIVIEFDLATHANAVSGKDTVLLD